MTIFALVWLHSEPTLLPGVGHIKRRDQKFSPILRFSVATVYRGQSLLWGCSSSGQGWLPSHSSYSEFQRESREKNLGRIFFISLQNTLLTMVFTLGRGIFSSFPQREILLNCLFIHSFIHPTSTTGNGIVLDCSCSGVQGWIQGWWRREEEKTTERGNLHSRVLVMTLVLSVYFCLPQFLR